MALLWSQQEEEEERGVEGEGGAFGNLVLHTPGSHSDLPKTGAMTGGFGESEVQSLGSSVVGSPPAPHALIYPEATKWYVSGIAN